MADDTLQWLAELCEKGILEKPRVTNDGDVIRYRLVEKYRQHLAHVTSHPELWETSELREYKELFEKLAPIFEEKK